MVLISIVETDSAAGWSRRRWQVRLTADERAETHAETFDLRHDFPLFLLLSPDPAQAMLPARTHYITAPRCLRL
jgi:hypothetical protein